MGTSSFAQAAQESHVETQTTDTGEVIPKDFDIEIFLGFVEFNIDSVMQTEAEKPRSAEKIINALKTDKNYWQEQTEKHDGVLKGISKMAVDLTEQHMDEIRLSLATNH